MGAALSSCTAPGTSLVQALIDRDLKAVQQLLDTEPRLVGWRKLGDGVSPLHIASAIGPVEAVDAIVRTAQRLVATKTGSRKPHSMYNSFINHRNIHGQTALMIACKARNAQIVSYLLAQGADPLLFDSLHAKTCLHYAVLAGSASCCRALLGDDVIVKTHAGKFERLRDTSIMDSQGFHRFIDVRCIFAFAPLHFAVSLNNSSVVRTLIEAGANISVRCTGVLSLNPSQTPPSWRPFATPLHIATARGNIPVVVMLLESLATGQAVMSQDVRTLPDFLGQRAVDIARRQGLPGIAQLLDPTTPLTVVLQRIRPGQMGPPVGPPPLKQIAATAQRHRLYNQLLALNEDAQKVPETAAEVVKEAALEVVQQQSQPETDGLAELMQATERTPHTPGSRRAALLRLLGARGAPLNVIEGEVQAWGQADFVVSDALESAELQDWQVRYGVSRARSSSIGRPSIDPLTTPNALPADLVQRMSTGEGARTTDTSARHMSDHGGSLYWDNVLARNREEGEAVARDDSDVGGSVRNCRHRRIASAHADHATSQQGANSSAANSSAANSLGGSLRAGNGAAAAMAESPPYPVDVQLPSPNRTGISSRQRARDKHGKSGEDVRMEGITKAMECTICCDAVVAVSMGCGHKLCVQCGLHLVDPEAIGPAACPFCRAVIAGFKLFK